MRNLAPTTLRCMPVATHTLADLEARYLARRIQLQTEAPCAILVGRAQSMLAQGLPWYGTRYADRPRDGRGRYLSQAWLDAAEGYSPADTAWFRSPIR